MRVCAVCRKDERGVILITAAAILFVLLAFVGLAFDVGYMQWARRRAQTAADGAAVAGAWAVQQGEGVVAKGKDGAADNGFKDKDVTGGNANVTVTINNPPSSGSYAGVATAVEAIVEQKTPVFFMNILGFNILPIRARAVAQANRPSTDCVFALKPNGTGGGGTGGAGLNFGGNANLTFGCGAVAESTDSNNALNTSSGVTINMTNGATLSSVGGYTNKGTVNPPYSLDSGVNSPGDPLASLAMPTYTNQPCFDQTTWAMVTGVQCNTQAANLSSGTYQPGVYCGGIVVNAGASVSFSPGMYILAGGTGLSFNAGAVTGNGVTFYFTSIINATYPQTDPPTTWPCSGATGNALYSGPLTVNSSAVVDLSAPVEGSYAGILFFQNRDDDPKKLSDNNVNGGSNFKVNGAIYFPNTSLSFSGSSDPNGYLLLIANVINFTGSSTLTLNDLPSTFVDNNPAFANWVAVAE